MLLSGRLSDKLVGVKIMVQAILKSNKLDFESFMEWYPESTECHYELHSGEVIEMPKPRG